MTTYWTVQLRVRELRQSLAPSSSSSSQKRKPNCLKEAPSNELLQRLMPSWTPMGDAISVVEGGRTSITLFRFCFMFTMRRHALSFSVPIRSDRPEKTLTHPIIPTRTGTTSIYRFLWPSDSPSGWWYGFNLPVCLDILWCRSTHTHTVSTACEMRGAPWGKIIENTPRDIILLAFVLPCLRSLTISSTLKAWLAVDSYQVPARALQTRYCLRARCIAYCIPDSFIIFIHLSSLQREHVHGP